jgi:hypothetical protein
MGNNFPRQSAGGKTPNFLVDKWPLKVNNSCALFGYQVVNCKRIHLLKASYSLNSIIAVQFKSYGHPI